MIYYVLCIVYKLLQGSGVASGTVLRKKVVLEFAVQILD